MQHLSWLDKNVRKMSDPPIEKCGPDYMAKDTIHSCYQFLGLQGLAPGRPRAGVEQLLVPCHIRLRDAYPGARHVVDVESRRLYLT